jgi:catechol 2,3-dioxygenase-like lactoylglutathione lyase family enzyme
MVIATFKDLCMDAGDALVLARFWRHTLGGSLVDRGDGSARIDPPAGRGDNEVIWVDPVPEPHTVKTRVHLDVVLPTPDPGALVSAGGRVLREPGEDRWWLMADPDGNQFCAFPPDEHSVSVEAAQPVRPGGAVTGVHQLVLDCRDPQAIAGWWADVLGGELHQAAYGPKLAGAGGFPWRYWLFQSVPEPKTVKNRVHWDVTLAGAAPDPLVERGARILREPGGDISWWVLTDPEGNEFCAFAPKST